MAFNLYQALSVFNKCFVGCSTTLSKAYYITFDSKIFIGQLFYYCLCCCIIILLNIVYRNVEHQIPLIAVGLRETKELVFKPQFKVCINSHTCTSHSYDDSAQNTLIYCRYCKWSMQCMRMLFCKQPLKNLNQSI